MNVLVTGAAGFIGRALCEKLQVEGWRVFGTIRTECQQPSLIAGVAPVVIPNIGPTTEWRSRLSGINVVVHLAARVHYINDDATDPLAEFRQENVAATANLARQAAAAGVRRFVFISSIKVNGEGGTKAYTEDDVPAPQDPYGISKYEAEAFLRQIAGETGLDVVILRPPLVYGPGVRANFRSLLHIVQLGIPLPMATIDNRRSFIYLGNLIDVIALCCLHHDAVGRIYVVCDGESISTPELIRCIASAMEKQVRMFPFPIFLIRLLGRVTGKTAQVSRLLDSLTIDSGKIRNELGWTPSFTMEQGLVETAKWFQKRNSAC